MKLHCLHEAPPAWLGEALERFEQQFRYPLGTTQRFSISHGRDYLPFFRAMGQASLLVVERDGEVLGTLARVERWIEHFGATPMKQLVHYLCDLKVTTAARGSRVLATLMQAARHQIEQSGSRSCYCIVMDGTGRLPTDYTGRIGIPGFEKAAEIVVIRLSAGTSAFSPTNGRGMPAPAIRVTGGTHELRSLMVPDTLRGPEAASAVLEDTRRGKRLWLEDGSELLSAHVSNLHFESVVAGASVLRQAFEKAQEVGFPAIFTTVPILTWQNLRDHLKNFAVQEARASIFTHCLPTDCEWWVDTADI